jgi:3-oxo-5-alpha-steroid 4-dehydrogenase 1
MMDASFVDYIVPSSATIAQTTGFDFDRYTSSPFYNDSIRVALVMCVYVFILSIIFPSPYGKFGSGGGGGGGGGGGIIAAFDVALPPKLGWLLMELPAPLSFVYFFFFHTHRREFIHYLFLAMWCLHYSNRTFYFPLTMRPSGSTATFSLIVVVTGWMVTSFQGYFHSVFIAQLAPHLATNAWLQDPRFILGFIIYYTGFFFILHSEAIQRNLRPKTGAKTATSSDKPSYQIPRGGLFDYVTNATYAAELFAWAGFALCTWSLAGVFIFSISLANLLPRAFATHRWYHAYFKDKYPADRKIIIPFIL